MKKILTLSILALSAASFMKADAQVRVNVNVNVGSQPSWGPRGYDYVDYYYLPDIDAYYSVPTRQFIYLSGPNWVFSYGLPPMYRNYDLSRGRVIVVNRQRPWLYNDEYRVRYRPVYNYERRRDDDEDWDDRRGPGNNGRGHAYGHYKHGRW